jgi:hypothetical protein
MPVGTNGGVSFEFNMDVKVPHLRNEYQKVGRFGAVGNDHGTPGYVVGDQVRGFGLEFNGSLSSLLDFHAAFPLTLLQREQVSSFVLAFDTGLRPAVGEQVTMTSASVSDVDALARLTLLIARDDASDCDLVAHGHIDGAPEVWRYGGGGIFAASRALTPPQTTAELLAAAGTAGQEITFTCVPPRNGRRYGNDADEDLVLDGDEIDAGSDPHDPASVPASFSVVPIASTKLLVKDRTAPIADPSKRKLSFKASTKLSPAPNRIVPPAPGSAGDPRSGGAQLIVYNVDESTEEFSVVLAAESWTLKGTTSAPKGYQYKSLDPEGPVKKVSITGDKLSISAGRAKWGYSLDEPQQGGLAIRMVLGTGIEWCTAAVAGKVDTTDKFIGESTAPPVACAPF